jgi:hypothetical protein
LLTLHPQEFNLVYHCKHFKKENKMTAITTPADRDIQKPKVVVQGGGSDSVYGLGFIGALVYFISQARDFREGVIGFFKAIVWPAILVYEIFKLLKIGQSEANPEPPEKPVG